MKPLQYIVDIIIKIINNFKNTLNIFRIEAKKIRGMFKEIVEKIAIKLTNSYAAIQFYQSKMATIIKKQMAIFQILMYFAESMKMTMVSLANGPIIDLVKFLPVFGVALMIMIPICLLCMFGGPFIKMFACPICLVCFQGSTLCLLSNNTLKKIDSINIGDDIMLGGEVVSIFKFSVKNRKCDMFNFNNILVSGSHIVFNKDNAYRINNHKDSIKIDYKDNVSNAVKRMTAGRIGCLGVTKDGNVVGVISERDYLNKIALLEKDPNTVKVEQICTFGEANLVKVRMNDNIDKCMEKMLGRDIRHLLVMENKADGSDGSIVGMISIKDVVKCTLAKANAKVDRLEVIVQTQDMMRHQI